MWSANLKSSWSQVLAGGAALLGFGTVFGGAARADVTQYVSPPTRAAARADEVIVRIVGENIHISQDGSSFEELQLGNTAEVAHLKKLLRDAGGIGESFSVPIGSMIVASGGGRGNGDKPKESADSGKGK